jgi:hypothetical protein
MMLFKPSVLWITALRGAYYGLRRVSQGPWSCAMMCEKRVKLTIRYYTLGMRYNQAQRQDTNVDANVDHLRTLDQWKYTVVSPSSHHLGQPGAVSLA